MLRVGDKIINLDIIDVFYKVISVRKNHYRLRAKTSNLALSKYLSSRKDDIHKLIKDGKIKIINGDGIERAIRRLEESYDV